MIIRAQYMTLFLIGSFAIQVAHANVLKDAARLVVGAGAGAAVGYGFQVASDPTSLSAGTVNVNNMAFFSVLGTLCGGLFTSYGKVLRVELQLQQLDQQLLAVVIQSTYDKNPAEIVAEIQNYFQNTAFPLIAAVESLVKQDDYLGAAILLLQDVIAELPAYGDRTAVLEEWLDELNTTRTAVDFALEIIKQDPQFIQMLSVKRMQMMKRS